MREATAPRPMLPSRRHENDVIIIQSARGKSWMPVNGAYYLLFCAKDRCPERGPLKPALVGSNHLTANTVRSTTSLFSSILDQIFIHLTTLFSANSLSGTKYFPSQRGEPVMDRAWQLQRGSRTMLVRKADI